MKLYYLIPLLLILFVGVASATGVTTTAYGTSDAYIANYGYTTHTVSVVNTTNDTIIATLSGFNRPYAAAVTRDGKKVYITNQGSGTDSNTVFVVNTATNTISAKIAGLNVPGGLALTPDDTKIYVTNNGNESVAVINTATNTISATITGFNIPDGIVITPDGTKAYVTNYGSASVAVINTATNTISTTIAGFNQPTGISITPDGTKVYVANYGNASVAVINTATNTISTIIAGFDRPQGVAVTPDGTKVYVANIRYLFNKVVVINTSTDTVLTTIAGCNQSCGMAITPDGAKAYATNIGNGSVTVINTATNTIPITIPGFNMPYSFGLFMRQTLVPTTSFTSNVTSGMAPLNVAFTDTSTGTPTIWDWDYGDGSTHGTTKNPTHQYTSAGTYTVTLNASNVAGYSINTQTNLVTISNPACNITSNTSNSLSTNVIQNTSITFNETTLNAQNVGWYLNGTIQQWNNTTMNFTALPDTSGNNHVGTLYNTNFTNDSWGNDNAALAFNNVSSYVDLGTGISPTSGITVSAWIKTSDTKSLQFITGRGNTGYIGWYLQVNNGNAIQFFAKNGTTFGNVIKTGYITGTWAHVVATYNGSYVNMYLNGISATPVAYSGGNIDYTGVANTWIGQIQGAGGTSVRYFNGSITNVKIWNRALTATEVVNLDAGGQSSETNGLIGWWQPQLSFSNYTYNFPSAGTQNITVIANNTNNSVSKTWLYTAYAPVSANFTANTTSGTSPLGIQFYDNSTGSPLYYNYSFGDNTENGTTASPIHTYASGNKNYTVILTVGSPIENSTFTRTSYINITDPIPTVSFSANVTSGNYPQNILFTDASSGLNITTYNYSFGDGTYSSSQNPIHNYSAGIYTVIENVTNNGGTGTYTRSNYINISKITPTINWNTPADINYGTSLNSTQLDANVSGVSGSLSYSPANGTILGAGNQTLNVTFTPNDPANYSTTSKTVYLQVAKINSTVSWSTPETITYPTALSDTQLNPSSGGVAGSFTFNPTNGTILSAGNHTLNCTFNPTDLTNYSTASGSTTIIVNRSNVTVTWSNPDDIVYGTPLNGIQLNCEGSVLGTFEYNPDIGTILPVGSNDLRVVLHPNDNVNYTDGSQHVTLNVTKAVSTINWTDPEAIVYGTPLNGTQLNATTSDQGTLTYIPVDGTVLGVGVHTLHVDFTPDDAANYTNVSKDVSINVSKIISVVTWNNPNDIVYGTALNNTQLDATASVNGSFDYTPLAGTVLGAGNNSISVDFTPDDSSNYTTASANVTLIVSRAPTTVSWENPDDSVYGTPLNDTQLNASASVAGSFVYDPTNGTLLGVGAHTLHVDFSPTDVDNYTSSAKNVSLNILKATPVISWNPETTIVYGTPLNDTQLDATASIDGTFDYTPTTGTVIGVGDNILSVLFTPDDANNYTSVTQTVNITVIRDTPTISWNNPADIIHGSPLSSVQLNANVSVSSNLTYVPPAGTVLSIGTNSLNVTVSPYDITNYTTATAGVTINVIQLSPIVNFTTNVTSGVAPVSVQFFDTSENEPLNWTWNFGDGVGSHEQNPVHTYTSIGHYDVTLDITNTAGNDTITRTGYILIVAAPVANFTADNMNGTMPMTVHFNDTSENNPVGWGWDFGDGNQSTEQNPTHTYINVGNYTVSLTVSNLAGVNTKTVDKMITVSETVHADFIANITNGTVPMSVQFNDTSIGNPTSWYWDFGDNVTSYTQNPVHEYNKTASNNNTKNYTVTLTVSNNMYSDNITKTEFIQVNPIPNGPPIAQFYPNVSSVVIDNDLPINVTVLFNDTSIGNDIDSWFWTFGDGVTSTNQNPEHTYNATGVYSVSLISSSHWGSTTSTIPSCINITRGTPPVNWTSDRTVYYAPATVQFTNRTVNYTGGSYYWDFGDGTNSTTENPTHVYQNDSIYHVTLTVNRGGTLYNLTKDIVVKYTTRGTVYLVAVQPDQLNVVNSTAGQAIKVEQTSRQAQLYSIEHAVTGGANTGLLLAAIAIIILGAAALLLIL